jgi:hypothetical protein
VSFTICLEQNALPWHNSDKCPFGGFQTANPSLGQKWFADIVIAMVK